MAGCTVANGYTSDCSTTNKRGGLKGRAFLLNLNDTNGQLQYTEANNTVSAITVPAGGSQAFLIEGQDLFSTGNIDHTKPNANHFYTQIFNLKVIVDDGTDLSFVDEILAAQGLVLIVEDMNKRFIMLGQNTGLKSVEETLQVFGEEAAADVGTTMPLQGEEESPYKFVDVGTGYTDTLTLQTKRQ